MSIKMPEQFETDRLVVQRLRYEDASEIFYAYASKPEATKYLGWPTHESIRDTDQFLKYAVSGWRNGKSFSYSIRTKDSNRLIGSCGVINDAGKVQFGYVLGPLHWGKGYATEVCMRLVSILRKMPEIYRVGTFVDSENSASAKVLLKCGLEQEAHLVKWFRFVNQSNEPKDCILFKLPL
jgi:[ribosomal protein S5]-alanine N-acetyltransferase